MKTILSTFFVIGLLTGAAQASQKNIFTQINDSAPLSGTFEELAKTAPRSDEQTRPRSEVFSDLTRTAPHAPGVFADLELSAP